MSKKNYVRQVIAKNGAEFNKYEKALNQNYPRQNIFSYNYIERYRSEIKKTLNPIQGINLKRSSELQDANIKTLSNFIYKVFNQIKIIDSSIDKDDDFIPGYLRD